MVWAAAQQSLLFLGLSSVFDGSPRWSQHLLRGWKFAVVDVPSEHCSDKTIEDVSNLRCKHFVHQAQVTDLNWCRQTCCGNEECDAIQWCPGGNSSCGSWASCMTGSARSCTPELGAFLARSRRRDDTIDKIDSRFHQFDFNDNHWQSVTVPHDMLIDNDFSPDADKAHGFLPYRKGWYRLSFNVPADAADMKVLLEFGGIMGHSSVFLNEQEVATRKGGYTTFHVDISNQTRFGKTNLLAVSVDASWPDSWWYDGGGLYRTIRLIYMPRVHVAPWGVYLPARVVGKISEHGTRADATVLAEVELANDKETDEEVRVRMTITAPSGHDAAKVTSLVVMVPAKQTATVYFNIELPMAHLWSPSSPKMYNSETKILHKEYHQVVDVFTQTFGVRKLEWTSDSGFSLNGVPTKIKGFANHQDFAGVGVAVPDTMQGFRVAKMKEMGANAWRTAHNPPSTALLNACDQQGMLVMDEHHRLKASEELMQDLTDMIRRDRNHPSIFMWSMCNEALCDDFNATSARIVRKAIKKLDPNGQRAISAAMNKGFQDKEFISKLDVIGINYNIADYGHLHRKYKDKPLISSESSSEVSDRSIYANDPKRMNYVSAYDVNFPVWGSSAADSWCNISSRDYVAGGFYWTGFDYKGEPTPYDWPNVNSHFGVIDIAGFPKDNFYYHQSVYLDPDEKPVLHILPHWNWDHADVDCRGLCLRRSDLSKMIKVWAHTNGDEVELFLNGLSLGRRKKTPCRHVEWDVVWTAGVLRAEAYKRGASKPFIVQTVATTGPADQISATLEWPTSSESFRPGKAITALVRVEVLDAQGLVVPTAIEDLDFNVDGPARLIGLGNGDPSSHEHDKPEGESFGRRKAWNGLARAIVQSTGSPGSIKVAVTGKHLKSATLRIDVEP